MINLHYFIRASYVVLGIYKAKILPAYWLPGSNPNCAEPIAFKSRIYPATSTIGDLG